MTHQDVKKPLVDLDLVCSVILTWAVTILVGKNLLLNWAATVAAHQLPEMLELSQQEDFTILMGHPVEGVRDRIQFWAFEHRNLVWRTEEERHK